MMTQLLATMFLAAGPTNPGEAAAEMYEKAAGAYKEKDDSLAAELFYQVATTYPDYEKAPDALYYSGTLFYKLQMFDRANGAFARCREIYPSYDKTGEVTYFLGLSLFGLGRNQEAVKVLEEYLNGFPDGELRADAWKYIGMCYIKMARGALMKAEELYKLMGKTEEAKTLEKFITLLQ